eukprot:GFYU01003988.1.p1 GENE.GFYU01003988.1~~GFYU01003988.1.p1  ORF type:complete len:456 (-),score=116.70 GFYU01003988.1:296-1663(-)
MGKSKNKPLPPPPQNGAGAADSDDDWDEERGGDNSFHERSFNDRSLDRTNDRSERSERSEDRSWRGYQNGGVRPAGVPRLHIQGESSGEDDYDYYDEDDEDDWNIDAVRASSVKFQDETKSYITDNRNETYAHPPSTTEPEEKKEIRMIDVKERERLPCAKIEPRGIVRNDGTLRITMSGDSWRPLQSTYLFFLETSWLVFFLLFLIASLMIVAVTGVVLVFALDPKTATSLNTDSLEQNIYLALAQMTGVFTPWVLLEDSATVVVGVGSIALNVQLTVFTALAFARFGRPSQDPLMFSDYALIHNHYGRKALTFRLYNQTRDAIINATIDIVMQRTVETPDGMYYRTFRNLKIANPAMHHVISAVHAIMHEIDLSSPLYGVTEEMFTEDDIEIVVVVKGYDCITSQRIQSLHIYEAEDVFWKGEFRNMVSLNEQNNIHAYDMQFFSMIQIPVKD